MKDTPEQKNSVRFPPYWKEAATYLLMNRYEVHQQATEAMVHLEAFLDKLPEADAERIRNAIFLSVRERTEIAYQKGLKFGRFLAEYQ